MHKAQQKRFDSLYQRHISALQRQGKSQKTIEAYSRAVRRITAHFDRCPDRLTRVDLESYFTALIQSHSWSTVKLDRNGLQRVHFGADPQRLRPAEIFAIYSALIRNGLVQLQDKVAAARDLSLFVVPQTPPG